MDRHSSLTHSPRPSHHKNNVANVPTHKHFNKKNIPLLPHLALPPHKRISPFVGINVACPCLISTMSHVSIVPSFYHYTHYSYFSQIMAGRCYEARCFHRYTHYSCYSCSTIDSLDGEWPHSNFGRFRQKSRCTCRMSQMSQVTNTLSTLSVKARLSQALHPSGGKQKNDVANVPTGQKAKSLQSLPGRRIIKIVLKTILKNVGTEV